MPDVLNGKLLSAVHLLHACLDLPTLLSLAFPHSSINDLQGRGGASNVCTGCLLCFFKRNGALLGELFVSLEAPGQNGMVSRDSPLA